MERKEILSLIDQNITIKNPIQFGEKTSDGFVANIFPSKMLTEFNGSDPNKIIRIAVFAHKDQSGLWEGNMGSRNPHVLYGYYDFSKQQIDFIWQMELACRMCEGDHYFKKLEEKGEGKVMRLVYIEYP